MNNSWWLLWRLREDPEPEKLSSSLQERDREEAGEGSEPAPEAPGERDMSPCWRKASAQALCSVPAPSAPAWSHGGFTPTAAAAASPRSQSALRS